MLLSLHTAPSIGEEEEDENNDNKNNEMSG